jgi:hypothetical protein
MSLSVSTVVALLSSFVNWFRTVTNLRALVRKSLISVISLACRYQSTVESKTMPATQSSEQIQQPTILVRVDPFRVVQHRLSINPAGGLRFVT